MATRRIRVGDHVRIVNFIKHGDYPVGVIERIDGSYIYVHTPVADETEKDRCVFEMYETEIVYITDKEYFKALLDGNNLDD